jgi:hypothetical protein
LPQKAVGKWKPTQEKHDGHAADRRVKENKLHIVGAMVCDFELIGLSSELRIILANSKQITTESTL